MLSDLLYTLFCGVQILAFGTPTQIDVGCRDLLSPAVYYRVSWYANMLGTHYRSEYYLRRCNEHIQAALTFGQRLC